MLQTHIKNMKTRLLSILIIISSVLICGCKNNEPEPEVNKRTILVYMIADNNIYYDALTDINEMEYGWNDGYYGDLLVFLNGIDGENTLYRINHDDDDNAINSTIVKTYPQNSKVCTKEFLRGVISDAMNLYPANSYALDLWSHGTGWLPKGEGYPLTIYDEWVSETCTSNANYSRIPVIQAGVFGVDRTNNGYFEAYDLAEALSIYKLDYLFFDACNMGSVECAYEMRNCCEYYISSAAEIPSKGAPYDVIISDMFAQPRANVKGIAEKFYNYYNALEGYSRTATISVVDCSKLKNVASELSKIVTKNPEIPLSSIQQYGRALTGKYECFFDLEDFVQQTWGLTASAGFSAALNDAVIYKAATPELFEDIIVNHHSGLSCYIPIAEQTNCMYIYNEYYSWATDSGLGAMVE